MHSEKSAEFFIFMLTSCVSCVPTTNENQYKRQREGEKEYDNSVVFENVLFVCIQYVY